MLIALQDFLFHQNPHSDRYTSLDAPTEAWDVAVVLSIIFGNVSGLVGIMSLLIGVKHGHFFEFFLVAFPVMVTGTIFLADVLFVTWSSIAGIKGNTTFFKNLNPKCVKLSTTFLTLALISGAISLLMMALILLSLISVALPIVIALIIGIVVASGLYVRSKNGGNENV